MRLFIDPSIAILLIGALLPSGGTAAQTTQSAAIIRDNLAQSQACAVVTGVQNGPTSASCPATTVTGGTGSASSAADNAARLVSASAHFNQGSGVASNAESFARASSQNGLDVVGFTGNDDFVFHFATNFSGGFTNAVGTSASYALGLFFFQGPCGPTVSYTHTVYANGQSTATGDADVAATPTGLDVTCHAPSFTTGFASYDFTVRAQQEIVGDLPTGVTGDLSFAAWVLGIDVVDRVSGASVGSFTLNANDGGATFNAPSLTTPEPSTVVLIATGLVFVVALARRSREIP